MITVRNKNHHADFDFFDTYKDALDFFDKMPKKYRKEYEIVEPQRNPFEVKKWDRNLTFWNLNLF